MEAGQIGEVGASCVRTVGRASVQYSQRDSAAIYRVDKMLDQDMVEEPKEPGQCLAPCVQFPSRGPPSRPSPPHLPGLPQSPSRPPQSPPADRSEAAEQVNKLSRPAVPAPGDAGKRMTPPSQGQQSSKPKLRLRAHWATPQKRTWDDSCGQTPAPRKRRKSAKSGKSSEKMDNVAADRGKAVLVRAEIDHARTFQRCHQSHHCFIEPGHWSAFIVVVGRHELGHEVNIHEYPCHACRELLQICFPHKSTNAAAAAAVPTVPQTCGVTPVQKVLVATGFAPVVDVLASSDEDSPPPMAQKNEKKKRGRPPSNSPKFSLEEWIGRERPGVYTFLPAASEASKVRKVD